MRIFSFSRRRRGRRERKRSFGFLGVFQRNLRGAREVRDKVAELLAVMRNDKKAVAGRLRLVLPRRLGEVALFDHIPEAEVRCALEESIP